MKIPNEKEKFSERLKLALATKYPNTLKNSEIATKFNLQHPNEPVTQQAVYKWLNGLAIPSLDKIDTLANWLNVKPVWLRYGVSENTQIDTMNETLIELISSLSEKQKRAILQMILAFQSGSE
ncbi:helix-turn-helix domain-containing protein [Avibacterium paragallinarum]|uniref:Helix-turn-helix domain-containing protein n=1 Tax=Avibacterium paragallinarum TaxID=728 RepID=A0A0F5EQR6_AVIPA|nr:helix-turn-helix domain-containing protein [Avibacterium paragallinarum]AZI14057.1 helix-turn-helix domain-containing protein [Avibacterium paragallinarum]KAA6209181.1 helix-turn-helix domain-containing protein [Avibacterium paragallinarum]KKB01921.1 DNA-binding protein [Avibacterium paragallinarum]MEE3608560.1 helix-turn-helix domain-containing protein [Avibacterium paragallinarum]MEE3621207.1 helix-turn-helix domain-containing protein [Avibacterium paragallinarum]